MTPTEAQPLFVVGLYRSGTTLLYALLNQHPQIALMYETNALAVPGVNPTAARWPRWAVRVELWNGALTRHQIGPADVEPARDIRGLYTAFAKRKGAIVFGEKTPTYCRWLQKVARYFPEARFIILLRELPEVYRSIRDAASKGSRFFGRKGQLPRLVWLQRALLRDAQQLQAKSIPVLYLHYHEIVSDPSAVGRRVCEFLGLAPNEAMNTLQDADFSAIYQAPHHDQVRRGIIERRSDNLVEIPEKVQDDLRMFGQASGQRAVGSGELSLSSLRQLRYFFYLGFGRLLCGLNDAKRWLYEVLPAVWFQSYRRFRKRTMRRKDGALDPGSRAKESQ